MIEFFSKIYNSIFHYPILSLFVFLIKIFKNPSLAIISLAFLMKLIFFPLDFQALRFEKKLKRIQKEISNLQKEKKLEKMLELLKKEKFNPFFYYFTFLIQLPILIAIYQILSKPAFFGKFLFYDLSHPNLIFPLLIAILLIFSTFKTKNFFIYFSAFLTFFILLKLPSAFSLYLLSSFILSFLERSFLFKKRG